MAPIAARFLGPTNVEILLSERTGGLSFVGFTAATLPMPAALFAQNFPEHCAASMASTEWFRD